MGRGVEVSLVKGRGAAQTSNGLFVKNDDLWPDSLNTCTYGAPLM